MRIYVWGVLFFSSSFLYAQQNIREADTLMQLDRDFDRATADKGIEGWVTYFAPNGSMLSDTNMPVTGRDAIRKDMESLFQDSTFSLRWHPLKAEMMIPGVIGYTIGRYEGRKKNKTGTLVKWSGKYSSTWKKQPDGSWKIVLDTGSPDGPATEAKQ